MANATIVGGFTRQQEHYQFPAWIRGEHHGEVRIFLERPNNFGYTVINIQEIERQHPFMGRMQATIEMENNVFARAILGPIGHNLPPNTRARIYVGLPNGSTVTGYFV